LRVKDPIMVAQASPATQSHTVTIQPGVPQKPSATVKAAVTPVITVVTPDVVNQAILDKGNKMLSALDVYFTPTGEVSNEATYDSFLTYGDTEKKVTIFQCYCLADINANHLYLGGRRCSTALAVHHKRVVGTAHKHLSWWYVRAQFITPTYEPQQRGGRNELCLYPLCEL